MKYLKVWLVINAAIALVLGTAVPTLSIEGRFERFLMIRVETTNTGCALTEVWYSQFVGEVGR